MSKNIIFISMLGVSKYDEVEYYYKDEDKAYKTPYAQAAILCLLEEKPAKSLILLTRQAEEAHWENLKEEIKCFGPKAISISEDFEKLWELLGILTDEIPDGAELILDITHSFRYMPMFLLILADYLRTLKNITIRKVLYGKYDREAEKHPIIDITGLIRLQNWTRAVSVFNEYGRHELLQSLLNDLSDIRNGYKRNINTLKEALNMSIYIATCRGDRILDGHHVETLKPLKRLQRNLQENSLSKHGEFSVIPPLLDKVIQKLETLKNTNKKEFESVKLLKSARWAFDHKMYQQSITLLREGIISWIMEKCKEKEILNRDIREKYNNILNRIHWEIEHFGKSNEKANKKKISIEELRRIMEEELKKNSIEDSKEVSEKIMKTFGDELIKLLKLLQNIKKDRNLINHAFMNSTDQRSKTIIKKLQDHLNKTGELLGIEQLKFQTGN